MLKLKIDLHVHTREDPKDRIRHSACRLIERARELGFDAISITAHDTVIDKREIRRCARLHDILLIPGMEATLSGKHVLIINPDFRTNPRNRSLADLPRIKTENNLVIAPHPFFPQANSLKADFFKYRRYFDAMEFSHFYNCLVDFNRKAIETAERFHLPLVGTSDCHLFFEFGSTYSLVEAEKDPASILEAVKKGRVEIHTSPLSSIKMARIAASTLAMKVRRMSIKSRAADF